MLLCCTARRTTSTGTICDNRVLIELIGSASSFFFLLQQTRRPDGAAESKCQMRSCLCLCAATLRPFLSNMFHRCCFDVSEYFYFDVFLFLYLKLLCVVISQYAPLSLRPLTCEVISGHRWGPREQGCIQFQRPRKRSIFRKDGLIVNVLRLRITLVEQVSSGVVLMTSSCLKRVRWRTCRSLECLVCLIGIDQVRLEPDDPSSSCSAEPLRGPTLLAGFVFEPSMGAIRKTAKGCDPAMCVAFSGIMRT